MLVVAVVALSMLAAPGASGHEERASFSPDYEGGVPEHRDIQDAADVVVVCKPDSGERIADITDRSLRELNEQLLADCAFEHIQAAVDHVREEGVQGTNIYVMPGIYLEEPSRDEPCAEDYEGGVVSYERGYECPNINQLVGIFGDDPQDDDRECDNALCFLQLEGTGESPEDVIVRGGFAEDGDWITQHNGIKADRADGIYIANLTTELFRENSIYVHETNGYVLDRTITRHNDLYGILTFLSDHGLIKDCEAHHNGDGGIYPGSPPDIYAGEDWTGPLPRPVVEIVGCRSHHNVLGHSASAGNGIYIHDSDFFDNVTGIVTDSFVPDHPGMPVDHNWFSNNRIWRNNFNPYEEFLYTGMCDRPPAERGYEDGTVCPAFPLPVGTGILIAGGNHNFIENNDIWDNWRNGVMLFWVPAATREDFAPQDQHDTSHHNHYVNNRFGSSPQGLVQPNGLDVWWDDQGSGNCWQDNESSRGEVTTNTLYPGGLPDCDGGGSVWDPGNPVKTAGLVPCATYDREDNPRPPGCDWFETPEQPEGRQSASGEDGTRAAPDDGDDADGAAARGGARAIPATGGGLAMLAAGSMALAAAAALRRHRSVALR